MKIKAVAPSRCCGRSTDLIAKVRKNPVIPHKIGGGGAFFRVFMNFFLFFV